MKTTLKITLLSVAVLLLAMMVALSAALFSSSGSRWLLNRVPGLQVDAFEGRLGGRWQARSLHWQQGDTQVEVIAPLFDWSPGCLVRGRLCLNDVRIERLALSLPPSEENNSNEAIRLPDLKSPIDIELNHVQLDLFLLNGQELFRQAQLSASWEAGKLALEQLQLDGFDVTVNMSGQLTTLGEWPLTAESHLDLTRLGQGPLDIALQVDGELQRSLSLKGESRGYLDAQFDGQVQALAEHTPAQLSVRADGFKARADLPDTLTLNQVELSARGDLSKGYAIDGQAVLPAEEGDIGLSLNGTVSGERAHIAQLALQADPERRLTLVGELDWAQSLTGNAQLKWSDFPWWRLYPQESPLPVVLKQLNARMNYQDERYQGDFTSTLEGPAGPFTLQSPVEGDLKQVKLSGLQLVAGQGRLQGDLQVGFADGVDWGAAMKLTDFDPAHWVAELPGNLAGEINSQGRFQGETLQARIELDVSGQLRSQPTQLKAQAQGNGQNWQIEPLLLRLGDNRIEGQADIGETLQGHFQIAMTELGQLWPGLSGRVRGDFDLAGSLASPQGRLVLKGEQVAYADQRVDVLSVDAALAPSERLSLSLLGTGLRSGETDFGLLQVKGQGTLSQPSVQLSLQGEPLTVTLAIEALSRNDNWHARLTTGDINFKDLHWTLSQPANLDYLSSGRINLSSHCWTSGSARLCMSDQRLMPEPQLRMSLQDFPIESLAGFFPDNIAWKGILRADVQVDMPASGPKGRILVDAGNGTISLKDQDQWHEFPYRTLRLESDLTPRNVDTQLTFNGDRLGSLSMQARIDPAPADKPISGTFNLTGFELGVAKAFVPMVETLEGRIEGRGTVSGTLMKPIVAGQISLSGGNIKGGELPTAFENLSVDARINGEAMDLSGQWNAGTNGNGRLSGHLTWSDGLGVDVQLRGSRLPVIVEPYARLEADPDLQLGLVGNTLSVSGTVQVPRGTIQIRELPPSTVTVSDDTHIVGEEGGESTPMTMNMDVVVAVGSDRIDFSGFGLTAELAGDVHIGNNLDTRGDVHMNNGRFRAYGQRLDIRRARLFFAGPIAQPYLDVEAVRVVDDVTAGLRLSGNAEQPTATVFSEPEMSQEQALSYLVLGRPLGEGGDDGNMMAQAALALGVAGSAPLTGELASQLGIQDFQLDTEGSGNSTSVVASGRLTDKLSVRYGMGVFESASTLALRYQLSKKVYLEAASGLVSSLDLFYKRDF